MANTNWRVLLHATDGRTVTYTLSSYEWDGPVRRSHGISLMSTCLPEDLPRIMDAISDLVLSSHPFQPELPLLDPPF